MPYIQLLQALNIATKGHSEYIVTLFTSISIY